VRIRGWAAGIGVVVVVVVVVVVAAVALVTGGARGSAAPQRPAFGVLGSSCAPDRVAGLRRAGATTAMTEMQWAQAEPAPGVVDEA
jgi:hypothetical protein